MRDVSETLGFALPDVESPYAARPTENIYKVADRLQQQAETGEMQRQAHLQQIAAERLRQQQASAQKQQEYAQLGSSIGGTAGGIVGSIYGPVGGAVGSAVGAKAGGLVANVFDGEGNPFEDAARAATGDFGSIGKAYRGFKKGGFGGAAEAFLTPTGFGGK